jgi:hypothetical protein
VPPPPPPPTTTTTTPSPTPPTPPNTPEGDKKDEEPTKKKKKKCDDENEEEDRTRFPIFSLEPQRVCLLALCRKCSVEASVWFPVGSEEIKITLCPGCVLRNNRMFNGCW